MTKPKTQFDEIGYWSEVKLEIVRKYAQAYSTILATKHLDHYYIDGFAGAGVHISKATGDFIADSPLNALRIKPPFKHHFLIDLDGGRIETLQTLIEGREDVTLLEGDCNRVLLEQVFPKVHYKARRRALCLLDPYGLQLRWEVMRTAGQLGTIELFINFPIMDINRNALWTDPEKVKPSEAARLTAFWGDESWRQVAYRPSAQENLFGEPELNKSPNRVVVDAFRTRLQDVAGFKNVPEPLPMRNSTNSDVYYLFFASQNDTANKIVNEIFDKYRTARP